MMKDSTLLIGGTHGDERIGVEACLQLQADIPSLAWTIGNPKAFEQKNREYEGDLNRSAPGNSDSALYSERRAAELIALSKNFKQTIDIHGTNQPTGIFIIISRLSKANLRLAAMLPIQRIVIWTASSNKQPLNAYFPCGMEIECGSQESAEVRKEINIILKDFLARPEEISDHECEDILRFRDIFEVYGKQTSILQGIELTEFQEVQGFDEERFFPLLINVYSASGIVCYKMKRTTYSINSFV